ncbi:MAG: SLBB domain-containing protein, partial [Spirochaetales bacterium]|nr:SLBB domain-containing protein [Spirochaetales bacterium]
HRMIKRFIPLLLLINFSMVYSQSLPNLDQVENTENVVTKNYNESLALPENRQREEDMMNSANIDSNLVGFGLQADIFSHVNSHQISTIQNFSTLVDYQLTPGDMFNLTIQSSSSDMSSGRVSTFYLQLQKDFTIELPLIGKIDARGKSITELQQTVIFKVKSAASIQFANFTLERPAQFNVFINGGVNIPGSYPTTPVRTVIDAIATARGFKPGASYRKIELYRNDTVIYLDLAKYYEKADLTQNPYLQPGDRIHVPMAQKVAMVDGFIKYRGTYELTESENLKELILLAGGFRSAADVNNIEIHRTHFSGLSEIVKVAYEDANEFELEIGDIVFVRSMIENSPRIVVDGAVYGNRQVNAAPSFSPFEPVRVDVPFFFGASVLTILDKVGGPTPYAKPEESFIKRANSLDIIRINIKELWETRDLNLDVELKPGDTLVIPIENLLVFVGGEVNAPKAVRYSNSLKVFDYIMLAGGHTRNADKTKVYQLLENGKRVKISLDEYVAPGTVIYIEKNFAELSGEIFQDVMIYTTFINSIVATVTSITKLIIEVRRVESGS